MCGRLTGSCQDTRDSVRELSNYVHIGYEPTDDLLQISMSSRQQLLQILIIGLIASQHFEAYLDFIRLEEFLKFFLQPLWNTICNLHSLKNTIIT